MGHVNGTCNWSSKRTLLLAAAADDSTSVQLTVSRKRAADEVSAASITILAGGMQARTTRGETYATRGTVLN